MKLIILLIIGASLQVSAISYAQISLKERNMPIEKVIEKIRKQTGYDFFYNSATLNKAKPVSVSINNGTIYQVLDACFEGQQLIYRIEDKSIIIQSKPVVLAAIVVTGKVVDETARPIPGVTVRVKGTNGIRPVVTDKNGEFSIKVPEAGDILVFTYIGYKPVEIKVTANQAPITVKMIMAENEMSEVVINTGLINRKKESFTGAVATFTGDELKAKGNQNVIQSLRTLDPSIIQIENNAMGSNPNVLPTIELRGQTSISTNTLRDQFSTDPNQPLFILDGFETSLRTIVDLDMNIVASITILKDASSTAIYGSRASNGVIVIETKKPLPGKLRLSYTSDLNVELPDLGSYNMMNATEKLQFERLAGRYSSPSIERQLLLDTVYDSRLKEVLRGVNTDWLSRPLQTGFSHRHSINASGGDDKIRYDFGGNFRKHAATMIGSKRDDWGANLTLSYRSGIFNFSNRAYVSGTESADSPFGLFSNWAKTNPYYRPLDATYKYLEVVPSPSVFADGLISYNGSNFHEAIPNPYYNASLNSFNKGTSFNLLNNFQATADFTSALRFQLNVQINKSVNETTGFISSLDTQYDGIEDPLLKGSYTYRKLGGLSYTVNAGLTYAKVFKDLHSLTTNLRVEASQDNQNINGYTATGFPGAANGNPAFAYGFKDGSTPNGANSLIRKNALVGALNYSYAKRYNVDLNLNVDGSTAFGSNRRYAPYYSAGVSWNVINEEFMKEINWVDNLRLRANWGLTGNQNFNNVSESVYNYYSTINSLGQGVYLSGFGAENLEWQKTKQTSIGLDAAFMKNRLNFYLNAYQKITDPLVVAISLPSSTGLGSYSFNAGRSTVKGMEMNLRFSPVYKPGEVVWTLGLTGAIADQVYSKFDNKLSGLNNQLQKSNSFTRYRDGYSVYDLWAVRSLGIDPTTGKEVFLRSDGQHTFTYDPADEVVVGSSRPKAEGVLSSTLFYKGFNLGVSVRYLLGKSQFNTALYNKVENLSFESLRYNQDKRALYERWKNPGDVTAFKGIALYDASPMSSRFIQSESYFSGESINLGYEFRNKKWLEKASLSAISINAYSNDIFYLSSMIRERGIDYPYAKSISMSIRATFK
ncbi:SusC/RagA family TonB-linked outer membrane protein [Pedobacter nyackensis]|uniref:SusC/RagA family TonB-linked outer membrane protein n=1 Tax=Pedobacter nyackensis TaxID=475255 RepID=UPI00292F2608|nr:SusC/RagA family TonB-linked outer membrane protein [Pedobacter nyackensis]